MYIEIINKIIIIGYDARGTVMMGAMTPQKRGIKGGPSRNPCLFFLS
jgi:hypothetical protein